jgi:hypothetical protein
MTTNTVQKPVLQRVEVEIECAFFNLALTVSPAADPAGDGGMPTTIVFSPEQGEETKVEFVGTLEFAAFQQIIRTLDRVLTEKFGEPRWSHSVAVKETHGA